LFLILNCSIGELQQDKDFQSHWTQQCV